jgi:hypothetical protein
MTAADREAHYKAVLLTVSYGVAFCMGVAFAVVVQAVLS